MRAGVTIEAFKFAHLQQQAIKTLALSSVVGSFLAAGNANAAAEIAQLAVNDNRFVIIATLFLPAAGWVLFNIGTLPVTLHLLVSQQCSAICMSFCVSIAGRDCCSC